MHQSQSYKKLVSRVVGLYYAKAERLAAMFPLNTPLDVISEPSNQYDPKAITVFYGRQRIGYIPKDQTHIIHTFWSKGFQVQGRSAIFHPKQIDDLFNVVPAKLDLIIYFVQRNI